MTTEVFRPAAQQVPQTRATGDVVPLPRRGADRPSLDLDFSAIFEVLFVQAHSRFAMALDNAVIHLVGMTSLSSPTWAHFRDAKGLQLTAERSGWWTGLTGIWDDTETHPGTGRNDWEHPFPRYARLESSQDEEVDVSLESLTAQTAAVVRSATRYVPGVRELTLTLDAD